MSREQLFDYLCQHFGDESTVESYVFRQSYDFLVLSTIKQFYSYLRVEFSRYHQLLKDFECDIEFSKNILLAMASILNIMQYINTYSGKEIFKCSCLEL